MKQFIKVKNVKEGYHYYKDAPQEVAFLRNSHRHLFVVRSTIEVFTEDRELEFIMVQHYIDKILNNLFKQSTNNSCELMCQYIYKELVAKYGKHRKYIIEVSEDDENSALFEIEGEDIKNK